MRITLFISIISVFLFGCKPAIEKIYESSFTLRAARELDSTGDTIGARYYLTRALKESTARAEAEQFLRRIGERKSKAVFCIEDKKTDLEINQYPRIRHKHFFQLAVCLESTGAIDKALKAYKLSETAGSAQPQLYIRRALLQESLGDNAAAGKNFSRAVQLNREYPPALLGQALHFLRVDKSEAALDIAANLAASKPFYAEIIRDAAQNRDALIKEWRSKENHGR